MPTCTVDSQGRILLPSKWRQEQGIEPGTQLIVIEEDGRLKVQTRMQAVREAQDIIRKVIPENHPSSVDALIADRRREVAAEEAEARADRRRRSGKVA